jgi:hypothetical protein
MMRSMFRRAVRAGVLVFAALMSPFSAATATAEPASLPAQADVRVGRCVEPDVFRQLVSSRYHVEFNQVVAADIDRDGDIDVVATTDKTFTVWVNDGAGHLTAQRPARGPAIDGRAPTTAWRERGDRTDPSADDGASTPSVLIARAHAPPDSPGCRTDRLDFIVRLSARIRFSAPRAPPV